MPKLKVKKIDKYLLKYLKLFASTKTQSERVDIVNKIYQDGFEDGVNSVE